LGSGSLAMSLLVEAGAEVLGVVVELGSVGAWVGVADIEGSDVVLGVTAGGVVSVVVVWAYAKPTAPTMVAAATALVRVLEKFILKLLEE
jgi:hypothetical protein